MAGAETRIGRNSYLIGGGSPGQPTAGYHSSEMGPIDEPGNQHTWMTYPRVAQQELDARLEIGLTATLGLQPRRDIPSWAAFLGPERSREYSEKDGHALLTVEFANGSLQITTPLDAKPGARTTYYNPELCAFGEVPA